MNSLLKNLPNWLTYLRIALVPLFVVLMSNPTRWMLGAATVVFVVASVTDIIDGRLARHYGSVSNLGKLLDPLADKILVMAALVMLVAQRSDVDGSPWIPPWLAVLLLAREIWVTGLRAIAASQGVVMAAQNAGKWKSFLQMFSIGLILLHYPGEWFEYTVDYHFWGVNLLIISAAFSIWSAVDYTMIVWKNTPPESL